MTSGDAPAGTEAISSATRLGRYVELGGHPTWVSIGRASPETVLLLHGGLSNSDAMLSGIGRHLEDDYCVAAFDRRGHGRTRDTPEPFHYEAMADETIAMLEYLESPASIVGWSDGGNVGLLVALRRPELVKRLITIGSNYHHEGLLPMAEQSAGLPLPGMLASAFAERSPDGSEHFGEVVTKSITMFESEPELSTADLANISIPVLVIAADDDQPELAHTCTMYESIPGAQLAIVPGTSHFLPIEQPDEVARLIRRFLAADSRPITLMPARRA